MSPNLEEGGWELESAVARHERHPETFEIPSAAEREDLRPGDLVKLLFLLATEDEGGPYVQCEKMWVVVEGVTGDGYAGTLTNDPVTSEAIGAGDVVRFGPTHVASLQHPRLDYRKRDILLEGGAN